MEGNKFATMLHRNTNKISIILIYAVLEWILIILLLLNSLFSHLITKFAIYFGLKRPCPWCSRIDHCFEHEKTRNSYQDLVCETHATEISQLGYCTKHKNLAKIHCMCKDCLFSQPLSPRSSADVEQKISFLSCVAEQKFDTGETNSKCSCCDVSLSRDLYPPYLSLCEKREYEEKEEENTVTEDRILSYVDEGQDFQGRADKEDFTKSLLSFQCKEIDINEDDMVDAAQTTEKDSIKEDAFGSPIKGINAFRSPEDNLKSSCNSMLKLENWSDFDDHFLITIESIDNLASKKQNLLRHREVDSGESRELEGLLDSVSQIQNRIDWVDGMLLSAKRETAVHLVEDENNTMCAVQEAQLDVWEPELEYMNKAEVKNFIVMLDEKCNADSIQLLPDQVPLTEDAQALSVDDDSNKVFERVMEDSNASTGMKLEMIETEISVEELIDQSQPHDPIPSFSCARDNSLIECNDAGNITSSKTVLSEDEQSLKKGEDASIKGSSMTFEEHINHQLSKNLEVNNVVEENATDVSSQFEDLQYLKKRPLLKKEESGIEESLDGSFNSEISGEEGVLTIEHLKSVLKEERRARCALYEELEEERSANAIAAKQTMEMITRLQEEKATTQMEALQYQRMMDEQSEYDQEALQLLNELVVKVEKEKHELQMELEMHRKKVFHYEVKDRRRMKRKTSELSRNLSASFSNSEDSDQLLVDFDHESIDEDSYNGHPESSINTPANGVLNLEDLDLESSKHMTILDESLADFEAEKLSILEKLKELEEKLFTLSDEEGEYFEDVKPVVLFPEDKNEDFSSHDFNSNGFCKNFESGHHKERGNTSPDANGSHYENNGMETLDVAPNEERSLTAGSQKNSSISMTINRKLAIEEEVDNVYERLHALEADREFLKQSISSLKKGDKGMDLLQEILQYLRDLRSVELCTRKVGDPSGA
ncbi:hypothetical protein AQUCO_00201284v1 [Aquilegia coerulea]|uniref:GTD-binding domain-containing protein n=1 Tax=Aquilegia coerulea TaxID=218851 RepID=A0A2G5F771_AQUCA|nr:hypothetical protein AQUCO_00201284v1 [Aquilegia coerulea]PIA63846.1 hypothetical protein AQUCO_00201284v1 [Aquilegia coerulea]